MFGNWNWQIRSIEISHYLQPEALKFQFKMHLNYSIEEAYSHLAKWVWNVDKFLSIVWNGMKSLRIYKVFAGITILSTIVGYS